MKTSALWLLPVILAGACATAATPPGPMGGSGSSGSGGGSGTTAGSSGAQSGSTSGGAATPSLFTQTCSSPSAGSPVLRVLTRAEFDQSINDIFPQVSGTWTDSLPADNVSPYGFGNDAANMVGNQLASSLLDTSLSIATALVGAPLATLLPCATSSPNHACAETFLLAYGKRLFRRPVSSAEHDRYLSFFDASLAKSDFATALKWMIVGLIQSPNAVYRSEIGTLTNKGTRSLSPYEVATELAYTYAGSTPSADLLSKADSGNLGDPVALAKSLLQTAAGKEALQRFFDAYFGYTRVTSMQKPNVPNFSNVAADMVQETHAFIDTIVFQQGGGLNALLTSTMTTPSQSLAAYYGFPAPASDYAPITRPAGQGIGILAQGAFLATHANADASSPTQRGLFPFTRLLCHGKPTPPPNVPPIAAPQLGKVTTRERYEVLHADLDGGSVCASCHRLWDPMGFGFEHYDEAGRYRSTEGGLTIDAAAWVPNSDGSALFSFPDQEGLVTGLAGLDDSYACFMGYLWTYAYGEAQSCLGATRVSDLKSGSIGIADAFTALASELHFTTRTSQ